MRLLPESELIQTSGVDHADWNYRPLLGFAMRRRFALVRALLPQHCRRMLEIGFGSGVFMPDLVLRCDELYGIDIHSQVERVQAVLSTAGIHARLLREDAADMSFPDNFFDVIVAVSALEFIQNIDAAAQQIARVLTPGGRVVFVMPAKSPILDSLLHVLTGANPREDYADRRERTLPAMSRYFTIDQKLTFGPVYAAYALAPR
jgi:ubiquinone/menaquinone biosynthesis C-methylase UbiE